MKINEIKAMSEQTLQEQVAIFKADLAREKALVAGGTRPDNPGKIKSVRKTIARLLTVLNAKKREEKIKKNKK
ncbi:MAG: 50S ribosomal protein L29 [Candidatus Diapherotrites archaeon]|uniref:Large ribosomal subunit protein uL29 n=1 Tax=Candidatus Iainarchaeum sp. TaxID=3101447 RepID=A0A2D6M0T5_9ARCH|nr:50S ribosomal protein L29 [Candidatus Diapherotrites archaeon]|tara:strand:+ start:490 stop:708 length:219 start_codon:yes stop_codon:yes gene_type:complete